MQNTDEKGDIDAGGLTLVDPEAWDEEMRDAEARAAKEEGLRDSKHAPKRTEEKDKEARRGEEEEDVGMEQEGQEEEPQRGMDPKEVFGIVALLDSTMDWADKGRRKEGEEKGKKMKEDKVYSDSIWNFGRKLDRVVKGEMLAWGIAH